MEGTLFACSLNQKTKCSEEQKGDRMSRRVGIIGTGITECRSRWLEATYWQLAQWAVMAALKEAGMTVEELDSVVYGIYNDIFEGQAIPESALTGQIGMANKPGLRVSNGGATGAYAFRAAFHEVACGASDVVLCLGVEKATDCFDPQTRTATPAVVNTIAYSWDRFFENPLGGHGQRFLCTGVHGLQ